MPSQNETMDYCAYTQPVESTAGGDGREHSVVSGACDDPEGHVREDRFLTM